MLLQTNSYIVPRDRRMEHARLLRRFRQTLMRLGCDHFEVFEQVGANWSSGETTGRFVQIMRFRDRRHQLAVQAAERADPAAQAVVREFCELINYPYQQQQGLFAVGFYTSFLRTPPASPAPIADELSQGMDEADNGEPPPLTGEQGGAETDSLRMNVERAEGIVGSPEAELEISPNGSPQPLQPEQSEILEEFGVPGESMDAGAEERH